MEQRLVSILIRGNVWREDERPLSHEEFWEKFIEFIESNGWVFGGSMHEYDTLSLADDGI